MPGPEGQGPSPEDIGEGQPEADTLDDTADAEVPAVDDAPPEANPESPAPVETEEQPVRPSLGERVKNNYADWKERRQEARLHKAERRREQKEQDEIANNLANARERRIKGYAEVIKHGARSPEELQQMMADISFKDLKEAQERNKYGKGTVGKLKAFLAGERDFEVQDDGTIEDHNTLKEAGRRVLSTVFNRRTAVSAGTLLLLGALTGGVGWAAGGVLMGGVAGRGLAEMGELFAGKTREARENVLYAERARWDRMRALALETQGSTDDPARQGQLARELVDLMYRQGDNVLLRDLVQSERTLEEREAKFNKIRNRFQTAGELVGAAAGLTSILNGGVEHLDMDMFNKVDGQSVFHGVQQSQEGWQFLYSSGAEGGMANQAGASILAGGHFGAHALEATTSQVLAYTVAERTVPMLLASGLAWWSEKGKRPAGESADDVIYRSNKAERLRGQIGTASEYIRRVADENHNPVPNNPEGFTYDWNEQPKSLDISSAEGLDYWYRFATDEKGQDFPAVDPTTGRIVNVALLGVDAENNRIAYARFETADNGATHAPVVVGRLDDFLKQYHLHKMDKKGVPFSVEGMDIAQGEARKDTETGKKHIEKVEGAKYPIGYEAKFGKSKMFVSEVDMSGSEPRYRLVATVPFDQTDGGAGFSVWRTESQLDKPVKTKTEAPTVDKEERAIDEGSPYESTLVTNQDGTVKLPEGHKEMSYSQLMFLLEDLPDFVGEEVLEAVGVEVGRTEEEEDGKTFVKRFARYIDQRGTEHIFAGRKREGADKINFSIRKASGGKLHMPHPAHDSSVDSFVQGLIWNINEAVKSGGFTKHEQQPSNSPEAAVKPAIEPAKVEEDPAKKKQSIPVIVTSQGRRRAPEAANQPKQKESAKYSEDLINLLNKFDLESPDQLVGKEAQINLDDIDLPQATKLRRDLGLSDNQQITLKVESASPSNGGKENIRDYLLTLSYDKQETEVPLTRYLSWFK